MAVDWIALLDKLPGIFGLMPMIANWRRHSRATKALQDAILALRKLHFDDRQYRQLFEKATTGSFEADDARYLLGLLSMTRADVLSSIEIVRDYAERPDHLWAWRRDVHDMLGQKSDLRVILHRISENYVPLSAATGDMVASAMKQLNEDIEHIHDQVVHELKDLGSKRHDPPNKTS